MHEECEEINSAEVGSYVLSSASRTCTHLVVSGKIRNTRTRRTV